MAVCREKAELWQKADNLEYENLLKTNAMWMDDSNVSACMNCNNQFSLMLRKVFSFFEFTHSIVVDSGILLI